MRVGTFSAAVSLVEKERQEDRERERQRQLQIGTDRDSFLKINMKQIGRVQIKSSVFKLLV